MARLELEVERGPATGQRFSLEGDWTIGSGEQGPGGLGGDRWLSAQHAVIQGSPAGWTVQDLRSAEGTRVNGRPVREPVALQPGDAIEAGATRIVVLPPDVPALSELPDAKAERDASYLRNENRRSLDSRRLGAFVVDSLLMLPVYLMLRQDGTLVALMIAAALGLTYFFACESLSGQTLGKALFGLRVVRLDGRPLTPQAVSIRTVLRLLDETFVCLVGMLTMVLSGGRRRRLGDLAAGTVVTRAAVPFKRAPFAGLNLLALLAYPLLWLAPAAAVYAFVPEASMHACMDPKSTVIARGEGSCLVGGQAVTVVNAGHTLHVPGLDVALADARVKPARGDQYAVEIQVAMTNRDSHALTRSSSGGVMLLMPRGDGTAVPVRHKQRRFRTIAPGKTASVWYEFDLPGAALPYVTSPGAGLVLQPPASGGRVGVLQLSRASTVEGAKVLARLQRY
jgi:uncharacterized RDD family membrane protein YckC